MTDSIDTITTETVSAEREDVILATLAAGGSPCKTPGQALAMLAGRSDDLDNAARKQMSRGTYPFPIATIGGRRVVLVCDIAAALAAAPVTRVTEADDAPAANDPAPPDPEPARRRRGRPRKVAPQYAQGVDHA